jgi:hypothetical protein
MYLTKYFRQSLALFLSSYDRSATRCFTTHAMTDPFVGIYVWSSGSLLRRSWLGAPHSCWSPREGCGPRSLVCRKLPSQQTKSTIFTEMLESSFNLWSSDSFQRTLTGANTWSKTQNLKQLKLRVSPLKAEKKVIKRGSI